MACTPWGRDHRRSRGTLLHLRRQRRPRGRAPRRDANATDARLVAAPPVTEIWWTHARSSRAGLGRCALRVLVRARTRRSACGGGGRGGRRHGCEPHRCGGRRDAGSPSARVRTAEGGRGLRPGGSVLESLRRTLRRIDAVSMPPHAPRARGRGSRRGGSRCVRLRSRSAVPRVARGNMCSYQLLRAAEELR